MPTFGKPDQTGRSSGKRTGRAAKAHRPPKGEPWVWLTRELLASPAWRRQSAKTARLITFLLIEHMNHAGTENGNLKATHEQLRPSIIERPVVPRRRHRERYHVRHVQHSLAGALVEAAIKSGKLERLKAAIRGGRFDG